MKALVLAPFAPEALTQLGQMLPVTYESWVDTRCLVDPQGLVARISAERLSIVVVEADFLPEEVFQDASGLRLLGVCRSSLDHVDVEAATRHGVVVVNTPGRNAQAVAELTLGLMLALARQLCRLDAYVKAGQWQDPVEPYINLRGSELAGKTLGILGLGRVGRRVAQLAHAFGMSVLAYDPYLTVQNPTPQTSSNLPLEKEGFPLMTGAAEKYAIGQAQLVPTLTELMGQCDYVSIHVPDTPATEGLLSREMLATARPGCRIINTSNYRAVEEGALVDALQTGHIAGAAFDVFPTHPIAPNNPLLRLGNVVLTPHVGGATQETIVRHSFLIVEDIRRFLQGLPPEHLVNPEVWNRHG
jgi:D-3-phosphoglycerate dehydrogenase